MIAAGLLRRYVPMRGLHMMAHEIRNVQAELIALFRVICGPRGWGLSAREATRRLLV